MPLLCIVPISRGNDAETVSVSIPWQKKAVHSELQMEMATNYRYCNCYTLPVATYNGVDGEEDY